jgi:hypothetical protein
MLEPLKQWICDSCGQVIKSPEDGYVEWLVETEETMFSAQYGFKIIHSGEECTCYPQEDISLNDAPLEFFLGGKGYLNLLSFLDIGPLLMKEYKGPRVKYLREFVEFIKRLTVPYYEEARLYFKNVQDDEHFVLDDSIYHQENLIKIIQKYGRDLENE